MWKTFQAEFVALWKSRLRFASWIILLFMPLIYGFLFLSSFWSPFKNTDRLPIVVVNLDESGTGQSHSTESINLVHKLLDDKNGGDKKLSFTAGSSDYSIHVTDASDLYSTKEEVEQQVNNGKYSAAFVIPKGYGAIANQIKLSLTDDFLKGNIDVADVAAKLNTAITASGDGLIDFYNSFKMSYVAGEMTNMGSTLYKLIGDLLFPDTDVFKPVIDDVNKMLPLIVNDIASAQIKGIGTIVSGQVTSANAAIIKQVVAKALPMMQGVQTKLAPIIAGAPALGTQVTDVITSLNALATSTVPADYTTLVKKVVDGLTALNLAVHNLNAAQFQPIIDAVKTKVLGDMAKGNLMVDHRTYGKREGVVGEHDILNTYGYGLSPYFLSIVLWAGALLMVFLFPNKRYIKTENTFKNMAGKTAVWVLTGWIQTLLLFAVISIPGIFGTMSYDLNGTTVVIKQCINLGADQGYLILFGLFASTMFMLIVRGIVYTIRVADIGLFICVILLILQLVSSGGTFPVSMQPGFFKFLHKILPFTYTVSAIREIYWDTDSLVVLKDVGILLIIPAIFTATSIISGYFWDKKTHYKRNGKTFYRSMDKNVGSL